MGLYCFFITIFTVCWFCYEVSDYTAANQKLSSPQSINLTSSAFVFTAAAVCAHIHLSINCLKKMLVAIASRIANKEDVPKKEQALLCFIGVTGDICKIRHALVDN